jgi:hypothetical protein
MDWNITVMMVNVRSKFLFDNGFFADEKMTEPVTVKLGNPWNGVLLVSVLLV